MSPNNERVQKLDMHTMKSAEINFDFNYVDEEQAVRHALRIASHVSPFNAAAYWKVDETEGSRIARRLYQEGDYPAQLLSLEKGVNEPVSEHDDGFIPLVLREEQPLYIDDYQKSSLADSSFLGTNLFESCYIPIHLYRASGKKLVGILVAVNFAHRVGVISSKTVSLLEAAVYQLQVSLQHHDAVMKLEELYTLQSKMYKVVHSVSQARNVYDAKRALMDSLPTAFKVNSALLAVRSEKTNDFEILDFFGWSQTTCESMLRNLSDIPDRTMARDLHLMEMKASSLDEAAPTIDTATNETCLVTPLVSLGLPIGYLVCQWPHGTTPQLKQTMFQLCTVFTGVYTSLMEMEHAVNAKVESLSTLGLALESRDGETFGHTQRVVQMMKQFMETLNLESEFMDFGIIGAYLHDIGKISVPDSILLKPGALTQEERSIIESHTVQGHQIASRLSFVHPRSLEIILSHHERWDGTGYPHQLHGNEIPLLARMFSLIDVFDALTHERPYKAAWSEEEALSYLEQMGGRQFDPDLVNPFIRMVRNSVNE